MPFSTSALTTGAVSRRVRSVSSASCTDQRRQRPRTLDEVDSRGLVHAAPRALLDCCLAGGPMVANPPGVIKTDGAPFMPRRGRDRAPPVASTGTPAPSRPRQGQWRRNRHGATCSSGWRRTRAPPAQGPSAMPRLLAIVVAMDHRAHQFRSGKFSRAITAKSGITPA